MSGLARILLSILDDVIDFILPHGNHYARSARRRLLRGAVTISVRLFAGLGNPPKSSDAAAEL